MKLGRQNVLWQVFQPSKTSSPGCCGWVSLNKPFCAGKSILRGSPLATCSVGVSSGKYIFAPALRDYFEQLPDEVKTGQPATPESTRPPSNNWSDVWKHVSTTSQPARDTDQALQIAQETTRHKSGPKSLPPQQDSMQAPPDPAQSNIAGNSSSSSSNGGGSSSGG